MRSRGISQFIVNSVFLGVIFGLTKHHYEAGRDCSYDMVVWLYVMAAYHALIVVFALCYFVFSFLPCKMSTTKTLMELFGLLLFAFHISWLIYGNILVYNGVYHCRYYAGA